MKKTLEPWIHSLGRREALQALAGFLAGSPFLAAQQDPFRDHARIPALAEIMSAFDFEPVAYAKIPRSSYDYTAMGQESEFTLRRNREAFEWVKIVPRNLGGLEELSTATTVLGIPMAFPIMLAPTAAHVQLHPDGENATAQGCAAASMTPMIVSNNTSIAFNKVAPAAKGPLWFQLYPRQAMEDSQAIVEDAQTAGAKAIVVTVDQQATFYERQAHGTNLGAATIRRPSARGGAAVATNPYRVFDNRLWYEWSYLDKLRPLVKVPMLIKGVLTGEDAKLCLEHGADGIVVSNHGGRSLDYGPATLEALPEIVDAVKGRVPVLVDGGFRRGTDIFKALALGANAVCLGRVSRWALGAYGAPGVQRALEILQSELRLAMAQAGRPTLASIDRTAVRVEFS